MFWLDAAVTLGGLILPPVFDFVKKKFIKAESDTPERTLSALATTRPEVLAPYTEALARYLEAQKTFYNRDVIGDVSWWIRDLRAIIRPATVVVGFAALIAQGFGLLELDRGTIMFFEANIGSWFGHQIVRSNG